MAKQEKACFFLPRPSRINLGRSPKIAKGECRAKEKLVFPWLCRAAAYLGGAKMTKGGHPMGVLSAFPDGGAGAVRLLFQKIATGLGVRNRAARPCFNSRGLKMETGTLSFFNLFPDRVGGFPFFLCHGCPPFFALLFGTARKQHPKQPVICLKRAFLAHKCHAGVAIRGRKGTLNRPWMSDNTPWIGDSTACCRGSMGCCCKWMGSSGFSGAFFRRNVAVCNRSGRGCVCGLPRS